jgi:hypothetical protein
MDEVRGSSPLASTEHKGPQPPRLRAFGLDGAKSVAKRLSPQLSPLGGVSRPAGVPAMRRDQRGYARVRIQHHDVYLGKWGTPEARQRYDETIAAWLANGRRWPLPEVLSTVADLGDLYYDHAHATHRKRDKPTPMVHSINTAFALLYRAGLAQGPLEEFGPLDLERFQAWLAGHPSRRWARGTINRYVSLIVAAFRWGVAKQLVAPEQWQALTALPALRKGRRVRAEDGSVFAPRESAPVRAVSAKLVDATLPHLPDTVRAMVQVQRLTGMRPLEVCGLRPMDLRETARPNVRAYEPADEANKLAHLEVRRRVLIGPRAWAVLAPWVARAARAGAGAPVFPSRDHAGRAVARPYTVRGYAQAIAKACVRAFPPPAELRRVRPARRPRAGEGPPVPLSDAQRERLRAWTREHHWSPNQLRHARATELTRELGLHAAKEALGHASLTTTLGYVDPDPPEALAAAERTG